MKIESIRLKNFKSFKDADLSDLPNLCIIVGANGTGKSTAFQVFQFLRDAMASNVNAALARLGGSRGFKEVRSRNSHGPIEIELKFRARPDNPLTTYFLQINEKQGKALVEREILKYRRGQQRPALAFPGFFQGKGNCRHQRTGFGNGCEGFEP